MRYASSTGRAEHLRHVHHSDQEAAPTHAGARDGDQWVTSTGVVHEWRDGRWVEVGTLDRVGW
jgi:hypothetical protein